MCIFIKFGINCSLKRVWCGTLKRVVWYFEEVVWYFKVCMCSMCFLHCLSMNAVSKDLILRRADRRALQPIIVWVVLMNILNMCSCKTLSWNSHCMLCLKQYFKICFLNKYNISICVLFCKYLSMHSYYIQIVKQFFIQFIILMRNTYRYTKHFWFQLNLRRLIKRWWSITNAFRHQWNWLLN